MSEPSDPTATGTPTEPTLREPESSSDKTSAPSAPQRLHLTEADLNSPSVEDRVQQLRTAAAPQLVRQVGEQPPSQGFGVGGIILAMALAGLVGGLLGWGVSELVSQQWMIENALTEENIDFACAMNLPSDASREQALGCLDFRPWYGWNQTLGNIVFLGAFGLVLGAVLVGWESISRRSTAAMGATMLRAVAFISVSVVVGAWIAQAVFESLSSDALEPSDLHIPRGVAWAVLGTLVGLAIGASTKVARRAFQGAAGGLIGGFIGGFVFDFIQIGEGGAVVNRLVGLTITGVAIAVSISVIEVATRQHWLEIVSGGMAGKQFILYNSRTIVGSSPVCDITLIKDPSMSPQHLELVNDREGLEARPVDPSSTVTVNGNPVQQQKLNDSDLVQIGATVLRYRSKQQQMPSGMPLPSRTTPHGHAGGFQPQPGAGAHDPQQAGPGGPPFR